MSVMKATVRGGRIEMTVPSDWPDGTEVIVQPVGAVAHAGLRESDWSDSPEAIQQWLTWYHSLEPLVFTDDERASWEAAHQQQKQFEEAAFAEQADKLRKGWE